MGLFNFIYNYIAPKNVRDRHKNVISALCAMNPSFKLTVESDTKVVLDNIESKSKIILQQFFITRNSPLYVSFLAKDEEDAIDIMNSYTEPVNPAMIIKDLVESVAKKHHELEITRNFPLITPQEQELFMSVLNLKLINDLKASCNNKTDIEEYIDLALDSTEKQALLGSMLSLCSTSYMPNNRNKVIIELVKFAYSLDINVDNIKYCFEHQTQQDRENYIERIKNIKDDFILIHFAESHKGISKIYGDDTDSALINLLYKLGYTEKEIEKIIEGEFVFKFNIDNVKISKEKCTDIDTDTEYLPLTEFENIYGKLQEASIVDNQTGEHNFLYIAIVPKWTTTYICYSPYLGKVPLQEIIQSKDDFFVECNDTEGTYFLCTKESNRFKRRTTEWIYDAEEQSFKGILKELNIDKNTENYTIDMI